MIKLIIRCPDGHEFQMIFNNFRRGSRCNHPDCMNRRNAQSNTLPFEQVKSDIEVDGYELLSDEYKGSATHKLSIKCPIGHVFQMRHSAFKAGQRCPTCSREARKLTIEEVTQEVEAAGYKLLSPYTLATDKVTLCCPDGHVFQMRYYCFRQGQRCPHMDHTHCRSKQEVEIVEYLKTVYEGQIVTNCRDLILNPMTGHYLELDIWLPDLNKAIEYNSEHWHTGEYVEYKDRIKQDWCTEHNIELLVIWHNTWKSNKDFNILKDFIHGNPT